ncbi:hypothetical protein [Xenorhabdus innexi]|uniref:Uncharacterized protein n=1 Tax=Xenorhabdus innexi TaxID=290109 RepID=A0A1N6MXF9_9GAMM|nr:hypothetical protein [Xenorhabdus innexi]PHM30208.1 hypothetical protein Xinn_03426 [Xenorhabdus innexi]SIP73492.1 hypothetical protein XIS1_260013 [Xenorhabdus innexi]
MSDDEKELWHINPRVSENIRNYSNNMPEGALKNLSAIYEKRTKIIQYDCLDHFDTKNKPKPGRPKAPYQQPHQNIDQIYILERTFPEPNAPKKHRSRFKIFRQCWSGSEEQEEQQCAETYNYVMKNINSMEKHIPSGLYLYVIYSDMPQIVVCGAYDSKNPLVGHTSLIKGRIFWFRHDTSQPLPDDDSIDYTKYPVLLAGELSFSGGVLTSWNNRSGHYRPRQAPVLELGATDYILPRKLFKPTGIG